MATNQLYPEARHITITSPGYVKAGAPIVIGGIAGVVQTTAEEGEKVTLWLDGSYLLGGATKSAVAGVKVGDVVYANLSGRLVPSNTGKPFGVAISDPYESTGGRWLVEVIPFGAHNPLAVAAGSDS